MKEQTILKEVHVYLDRQIIHEATMLGYCMSQKLENSFQESARVIAMLGHLKEMVNRTPHLAAEELTKNS